MNCLPRPSPSEARESRSRCLLSSELFEGRRVLTIRHGDEDYRLQITATGKLILTK